jgi:hypothetical protein
MPIYDSWDILHVWNWGIGPGLITVRNSGVDPLGLDPLPVRFQTITKNPRYRQEAVMKQKKLRAWTVFSYQSNAIFSG